MSVPGEILFGSGAGSGIDVFLQGAWKSPGFVTCGQRWSLDAGWEIHCVRSEESWRCGSSLSQWPHRFSVGAAREELAVAVELEEADSGDEPGLLRFENAHSC